ncbi:hypothetical protein A2872_02005 [Candidatus Gottesmanbacteria bacterium RIFCSPHIGHO2_01_FULL_42_12]|uniref:peptide chain release factor N(5)-glutamine methyltransferase n=1 Tax=Candidatus Gottesmanbacteria bacterium RIFCSPHIGHO2_01_FULL_42_12 TaxID=1798377 RepID=A0A1F5Z6E3_9BACT|nr:MAG: hypothetical protein A2872_02005 [Candidatus Gottesmanbacteria bacterium RIFCSPHIGHO2_01_FULL_42_12]
MVKNDSRNLPEEYQTGFAKFYGRTFFVNRDVLIPRIESERLIDIVKHYCHPELARPGRAGVSGSRPKIADIGTGSGCIGITLKLENPGCDVTLIDISEKALTVAKINAERLKVVVRIIKHDLLDNGDYDLVVANLPYIPHARISKLDPGVRNYEPHLALDGGVRGLELIFRLLYQNLSKFIILEIDDTHTLKDFVKYKKFYDIKLEKDLFQRNRYLILERK